LLPILTGQTSSPRSLASQTKALSPWHDNLLVSAVRPLRGFHACAERRRFRARNGKWYSVVPRLCLDAYRHLCRVRNGYHAKLGINRSSRPWHDEHSARVVLVITGGTNIAGMRNRSDNGQGYCWNPISIILSLASCSRRYALRKSRFFGKLYIAAILARLCSQAYVSSNHSLQLCAYGVLAALSGIISPRASARRASPRVQARVARDIRSHHRRRKPSRGRGTIFGPSWQPAHGADRETR